MEISELIEAQLQVVTEPATTVGPIDRMLPVYLQQIGVVKGAVTADWRDVWTDNKRNYTQNQVQ